MKRNKVILLILLIILLAVLSFKFVLKDYFNIFLEFIYLRNDEKLVYKDNLVDNYISSLEKKISNYEEISKLTDCINASVIYRTPTYWYDEITINKGSSHGIKKGSTVINNEGLVGIVKSVYKNSSEVSLITNTSSDNKITVAINNNDDYVYGIISDYNKIKNELTISELTKDIDNTSNLIVITTNFTNTFKEGLIISKVNKIIDDDNGLSKIAITTPIVDYNDIEYVCVIK